MKWKQKNQNRHAWPDETEKKTKSNSYFLKPRNAYGERILTCELCAHENMESLTCSVLLLSTRTWEVNYCNEIAVFAIGERSMSADLTQAMCTLSPYYYNYLFIHEHHNEQFFLLSIFVFLIFWPIDNAQMSIPHSNIYLLQFSSFTFFLQKEKTTVEILENLDTKIKDIENFSISTQERQKRFVGNFLVISIGLYVISSIIFFFAFFPSTWSKRIIYSTPLLIFPILWVFRTNVTTAKETN